MNDLRERHGWALILKSSRACCTPLLFSFLNAVIVHPGRGDFTLSGFVAAACVAGVLVGAAYWLSLQQSRAAAWVSHTHEVLTTIARTRAALVDIQNGHRGFTISGQEEDLQPHRSGRAAVVAEMNAACSGSGPA